MGRIIIVPDAGRTLGCVSQPFFSLVQRAGPVEAHWAQLQITFLEGIGFSRLCLASKHVLQLGRWV